MTFKKRTPHIMLPIEQGHRVAQVVSLLFTIAQKANRTQHKAAETSKKKSIRSPRITSKKQQLNNPAKEKLTHNSDIIGSWPCGPIVINQHLFFYTSCLSLAS